MKVYYPNNITLNNMNEGTTQAHPNRYEYVTIILHALTRSEY